MTTQKYDKAPIVEAIIDIQTSPLDNDDFCLASFNEAVKDQFPISTPIASLVMGINAAESEAENFHLSSTMSNQGLRLVNSENTKIIQAKKTGMSFSQLPQYSDWETFSSEAKKYWEIYRSFCKPAEVVRLAIRYINRIDIPEQHIDIEDYLNLFPKVPSGIPQSVTGMLMQLQMPQDDLEAYAIIQEAVVDPAVENGFSVLLDIDIFKVSNFTTDGQQLWKTLEQFRDRKNLLFEACITDQTRRLIS